VKTLVDVLWYLDGHHNTLIKQSCPIPSHFANFVGFNKPELSKHRKHQNTNLSCDTLHSLSCLLFNALQSVFWTKKKWNVFKKEIETLVTGISNYADHQASQNNMIKLLYRT